MPTYVRIIDFNATGCQINLFERIFAIIQTIYYSLFRQKKITSYIKSAITVNSVKISLALSLR